MSAMLFALISREHNARVHLTFQLNEKRKASVDSAIVSDCMETALFAIVYDHMETSL